MRYDKLTGQPVLDGDIDNGAAGTSLQQGFGNPAPDAAGVTSVFGGGPTEPDFPDFEEIVGHSPSTAVASDVGSTANGSTTASTTTQTVSFSGSGLVFNNTFGSGATSAFINEVDAAENYLQSLFGNSCTVNCTFDVQNLNNTQISGENSFTPINVSYSTFVNALKAHATTPVAQAAAASLPSTGPSNSTGSSNNGNVWDIPVGEAQILGLTSPDGATDDTVILNSQYWTSSALANNPGDAEAVIEHELTEGIMGRIGSLGYADPNFYFWAPMDLFRFTASGQRDYTGGSDGQATYFSVNGNNVNTGLQYHNSVNSRGRFDGEDLADWDQVGADANAQDPFGPGGPGAGDPGTLSATDIQIMEALGWAPSGNVAPAATTADMIMNQSSTGDYEIYDIGNNAVLANYPLIQAGSPWRAVTIGGFNGSDTSDLLLRNTSTGAFELYDVVGNNASGPVSLGGAVGLEWQVLGFGDFSGNAGETDMLMRDSNNAALEVYNISNNQITGATAMGAVGTEWQFLGVGDFSGNANEADMLMRNVNNGALEIYDIQKDQVVSVTMMGAIGSEWQFAGVGDFSGNPGETDMLMRDTKNGALEVYNIRNDQVLSATSMGAIGSEWSVVGIGDFSGNAGETDMITRDDLNGAFEIYDIIHDSVVSASALGAVGLDWQVVGLAPYQSASAAAAASGSPAAEDLDGGNLVQGNSPQGTWSMAQNSPGLPAASIGSSDPAGSTSPGVSLAGSLFQHAT